MRPGPKLGLGLALVGGSLWLRNNPSACPYSQRFLIELPKPFVTRARLREILDPRPGERMLEVGPGTGYYAVDVAEWVAPDGTLEIFDIQQEMLDHTMREANERGLDNVVPTQGDATRLAYEDESIDAAYLVTVLGEIPDQDAALKELRRVLKPDGRVVFGEIALDPHIVWPGALRRRAEAAGLRFEQKVGGPLAYYARFTRA